MHGEKIEPEQEEALALKTTLSKLLIDETGAARLASAGWLKKWITGEQADVHGTALAALRSAWPVLAQFRAVLRNFASARALEASIPGVDSNGKTMSDVGIRESILIAYIFILCRIASREERWHEAWQKFQHDPVALLGGQRLRTWLGRDPKSAVIDIVAEVHAYLAGAYSIHDVRSAWPAVPELSVGVLMSRPGNFRSEALRGYDAEVTEKLTPCLAALRRFGDSLPPARVAELQRRQREAADQGDEFRQLLDESTRLSDARRPFSLRLYAMTLERMIWLAAQLGPSAAVPGTDKPDQSPLEHLGRMMDQEIEHPGAWVPPPREEPALAGWADDELARVAKVGLNRRSRSRGRKSFDRMAVPIAYKGLRAEVGALSVRAQRGERPPAGRFISIHIPEHELPKSVRWYDFELATSDERGAQDRALHRLAGSTSEATTRSVGAQTWARYDFVVAAGVRGFSGDGDRELSCGAAYSMTADGTGARVLVLLHPMEHRQ